MKTKSIVVSLMAVLFVFLSPLSAAAANVGFNICGGGPGFSFCFGNGAVPGQSWLMNPFGLPRGSVIGIIGGIAFWLLAVLGFIGIIGFVIAGIMYLLAAGNEDQAKTAKNAMKYSIIGIIVALIGYVIIQAVTLMLNMQRNF